MKIKEIIKDWKTSNQMSNYQLIDKIYTIIFEKKLFNSFDIIHSQIAPADELKYLISSFFEIPNKNSKIVKLSNNEILTFLQLNSKIKFTSHLLGKKLKEMGYIQKTERVNKMLKRGYTLGILIK